MSEIAKAYIQIIPSTKGISGSLQNALDPEAEKAGKSAGEKIGGGITGFLGTAGKITAGALSAAAAGVTALTKQAVDGFSNYEQLSGGVKKLFGDSADEVSKYADEAYKTSGLSANAYMETVTGFSASLISSLNGDTKEAARLADNAIKDMSDNANTFGTDISSIQNAYQGFAKQNYTMLDNLKLGYGGTKEEMARLIADASKMTDIQKELGVAVDESDMSFGNIINAISVMQSNLQIAGTTSKEAGSTIEGSFKAVSASWQNLIAGIGRGDELSGLIDNLVNSLLGEKEGEGLITRMIPTIESAITGIGQLIVGFAPIIGEQLPVLLDQLLPPLISAATSMLTAFASALPGLIGTIINVLPEIINTIINAIITNLPMLIEVGLQAIITLAMGIAQALPTLIPQIVEVVLSIVDTLINNIDLLVDASIQLMMGLAEGLINALPVLIEKAPEIIIKLVEAIITNLPKILQAGLEIILMLVTGIVNAFGKLIEVGANLVTKVKEGFSQKIEDAKTWGKDMIQNFIDGILEKWEALKESVGNVAQTVKDFIGFSEPDKGPLSNFHTYAPDMMQLFAKGIKDNEHLISDQLQESLAFDDVFKNTNVEGRVRANLLTAINPVNQSRPMQNNDNSNISKKLDEVIDTFEKLQVNVNLVGDASKIFNSVRTENNRIKKSTGYHALA